MGLTYSYYRPEINENLELAYAITVHKAQGSDFDVVLLIVPQKSQIFQRDVLHGSDEIQEEIGPLH
jgi:ATP-dependent exoDNAse (exonuclease V) alpha subunit